jgi:hypothetical protein
MEKRQADQIKQKDDYSKTLAEQMNFTSHKSQAEK